MKVLALNASPRGGGRSKTEFLLDHLVQGMEEAGAEVLFMEQKYEANGGLSLLMRMNRLFGK